MSEFYIMYKIHYVNLLEILFFIALCQSKMTLYSTFYFIKYLT